MVRGFSEDVLTNFINVRWAGGVDQQGLLAEYPPGPGAPEFENIQDVMKGDPTAHALDSGDIFAGVNMGASGLSHTVLTPGLVCFGKPRDGDACFIACRGFKYLDRGGGPIERGTLNDEGVLGWSTVADGTHLAALSFAGDAFFAVNFDGDGGATVRTSFDGIHWSGAATLFPPDPNEVSAGAVAAIKRATLPDHPQLYTYAACGEVFQDADDFSNTTHNLTWSVSTDGTGWSAGFNPGIMSAPGSWYNATLNYSCTTAGGSVGEGKDKRDVFVAAAASKTLITDERHDPVELLAMLTSAPAQSTTGSSWSATPVGIEATLDQFSWGLAATFVRTKGDKGYFLMSDHELTSFGTTGVVPHSGLYKSSDGASWSKIRSSTNWMATLSAIAKDLDKTTIVHI